MDFHIKFTGSFSVFGIFKTETHAKLDADGYVVLVWSAW